MNRPAKDAARRSNFESTRVRKKGADLETGRRCTLAALRLALRKTQADVAKRARMAQGDISLLENRKDLKISTLARYAGALGGRLEVAIIIGERRYVLEVGQ